MWRECSAPSSRQAPNCYVSVTNTAINLSPPKRPASEEGWSSHFAADDILQRQCRRFVEQLVSGRNRDFSGRFCHRLITKGKRDRAKGLKHAPSRSQVQPHQHAVVV